MRVANLTGTVRKFNESENAIELNITTDYKQGRIQILGIVSINQRTPRFSVTELLNKFYVCIFRHFIFQLCS